MKTKKEKRELDGFHLVKKTPIGKVKIDVENDLEEILKMNEKEKNEFGEEQISD